MALGKKCRSFTGPKHGGLVSDEGLELGPVRYFSTSFGRKRIVISNLSGDSSPKTPTKKRCGGLNTVVMDLERSPLEALPNDVLVRILCGVDHEDLNQLSHVSKSIREATLVAKQSHFAYSTPKKVRAFRTAIDFEDSGDVGDEIETPKAPKQSRPIKSQLYGRNLDSISVNLFN